MRKQCQVVIYNMKNIFNKKGFTLIEMLVSVAIFSIVLMIALGSILSIVAANRKARALTAVMNNITFGFENMTRALKTGIDIRMACGGDGITVRAINTLVSNPNDPFPRNQITFRRMTTNGKGYIARSRDAAGVVNCDLAVPGNENGLIPITSTEVDITDLDFKIFANNATIPGPAPLRQQPRVLITLAGKVVIQNINSDFSMQTTVSQRRLNLGDPIN